MGLLAIVADAIRRYNLAPHIIRALPVLAGLLVLAGIANVAILPLEDQRRNTYTSENALLPHQAITFFRETEWDIVRGLKHEVKAGYERNVSETTRNNELAALFSEFGLPAYLHDWETSSRAESGQNLYAINAASRGPHNEAIVLAAPYLVPNEAGEYVLNEGGVALLLSLARFFARWNFWHKNVVFVLSSNPGVALRQFVNAYHTSLQHTAGNLEGAVVLEYPFGAEHFDHIDIQFAGLNGQLPNLDLVNTANFSTRAEFCDLKILGFDRAESYADLLTSVLRQLRNQLVAGIGPTPPSAMFSGWRTDAITLRAVEGPNPRFDITTMGRVCESTLRSLNNLLEHFHQSFFFYFLLGPRYFVSIASYLPASVLVAASFTLMALRRLALAPRLEAKPVVRAALTHVAFMCVAGGLAMAPQATPALYGLAGAAGMGVTVSQLLRAEEKTLLNAMAAGVMGLLLSALSMVNFSLALVLGLVSAPLLAVRPGSKKYLLNFALASLVGPPAVLSVIAHYCNLSFGQLVADLIYGWRELGVWTWPVVAVVWVPMWTASLASM